MTNLAIAVNEAKVNITHAGRNGDLVDPVLFDASDNEIRQWIAEAIRSGSVPGIPADPTADFANFVIDRFDATEARPYNLLSARPRTPFGLKSNFVSCIIFIMTKLRESVVLWKKLGLIRGHCYDVHTYLMQSKDEEAIRLGKELNKILLNTTTNPPSDFDIKEFEKSGKICTKITKRKKVVKKKETAADKVNETLPVLSIIRSPSDSILDGADVICLDVEKLNGIDNALFWFRVHAKRLKGKFIIVAVDEKIHQTAKIIGKYDFTVGIPKDSFSVDSWYEEVIPIWKRYRYAANKKENF